MIRLINIGKYERGLLFRNREFYKVLRPGRHLVFDPLFRVTCDKRTSSCVREHWRTSCVFWI